MSRNKGESVLVGDNIGGREVLATWEMVNRHKDDHYLQLVLCKYGTQYVTWMYNKSCRDFAYGHYFMDDPYRKDELPAVQRAYADLIERVEEYNGNYQQIVRGEF